MKKNNSLKLFNILARRAFKLSKKRKLGWKWTDAQKWTSANIFQKYKGTKNISKIKVTNIDIEVIGILDGTIISSGKTSFRTPKPIDNCFSPFEVASYLLDSFEWFDIDEKISILNENLKVDLDLEVDGYVFAKTGIIKKGVLPNLIEIREMMRKVTNKSGYYPLISFYIVHIDGTEDDSNIPCNYYVLITFENSITFRALDGKGKIRKAFISKQQMPISEQERIALINNQKEEERKKFSKQKIQSFKLPSVVQPKKTEPIVDKVVKDNKANRLIQYNVAVEMLDSLLTRGIINKKQFNERFQQLGKNLKDGGVI